MNSSDDIVLKKAKPPFSSVFQSNRNPNEKILCSLCANAGVESVVRDDICPFCGDIGIKHGLSKDDDLFVVNSVVGSEGSAGDSTPNIFSGTFGGVWKLDKPGPPTKSRTLQEALKETEIKK